MAAVDDPIERTAYVDTFFKELAPVWLNYVAALHGLAPRPIDRPFTYIELGCGFGQTVVTNAAAYPSGDFYACDINPSHVHAARRYANAVGANNLEVIEASFEDLRRRELPPFDFVVLHGVYSWIGDAAKRAVREFVRDRLKPGGLAYVSYNCLPGWALEMPLRRLFRELAALEGDDVDEAVVRGVRALDRLSDAKLQFFAAHPALRELAKSFAGRPAGYLAHEYLGDGWNAYYSVDVADDLLAADLHYVGSATLADNHPALTTADEASVAVASLPSLRQRRLGDDFATNRAFRRDVFVRGAAGSQKAAHLNNVVVGRLADPTSLAARVRLPRGFVTFQDAFVDELKLVLQAGTWTIGDIAARLRGHTQNAHEIARNLTILLSAGELAPFAQALRYGPAARTGDGSAASIRTDAVANAVLAQSIEHRIARAIPSRALGNGFELQPIDALALSEWLANRADAVTLARRVADRLRHDCWFDADAASQIDGEARRAARNAFEVLAPMFVRLGLTA